MKTTVVWNLINTRRWSQTSGFHEIKKYIKNHLKTVNDMTKMSITQSLSNICKTTELISFLYWSCLLSRSFRKKLERNVQIAWQYHQAIWQYHFSHISLQDHFALVRFRRKLRPYPVVLPFSCDNCWSKTPGGIHTTTSVLHLQRYRSTISQDRQLYFEYNQTSLYPPPVIRPTPLSPRQLGPKVDGISGFDCTGNSQLE